MEISNITACLENTINTDLTVGSRRTYNSIHSAAPTSALKRKVKSLKTITQIGQPRYETQIEITNGAPGLKELQRCLFLAWAAPPCRHRRERVPNHIASVPGSGTRELLCRNDSTETEGLSIHEIIKVFSMRGHTVYTQRYSSAKATDPHKRASSVRNPCDRSSMPALARQRVLPALPSGASTALRTGGPVLCCRQTDKGYTASPHDATCLRRVKRSRNAANKSADHLVLR